MLKKYKENQIYKFNYGNLFKFLLSQYIIICYHFFAFLCLFAIVFFGIERSFGNLFKDNELISTIINALSASLIVLWLVYLTIILFIPKKAIIETNFLKIRRYFLNFSYLTRGFNAEIFIKDIIVCKLYDGYRYRLDRSGPYSVYFFNWDDLVEIKTKDDKSYLVPLKNSEEFVEEVNKRMDRLNSHS